MVRETKPFYLTSEFYASLGVVLASIATAAAGVFSARIAGYFVAASTAAYAVSRGLAKSGTPLVDDLQLLDDGQPAAAPPGPQEWATADQPATVAPVSQAPAADASTSDAAGAADVPPVVADQGAAARLAAWSTSYAPATVPAPAPAPVTPTTAPPAP